MDDRTQPDEILHMDRSAPRRGRFAWLARWWNQGLWQKVAVVTTVLSLVSCACCGGGLIFAASPQGQQFAAQADATSTAQALADAQTTATANAYALAHPSPTVPQPTATPYPTATAQPTSTPISIAISRPTVTAGTSTSSEYPHAGGPLSDFIAAYGQPFGQGGGGSDNFWADNAQTIVLNVDVANNTVTQVSVIGPTSWSNQQTFMYCAQFLPSDATEFNSDSPYTDYHSSAGEAIIENLGQGTCLTYIA